MRNWSSVFGTATIGAATVLSASCSLNASAGKVTIDGDRGTITAPKPWSRVPWPGTTVVELRRQVPTGDRHEGRIMVFIERRLSHDEALYRLRQVDAEAPGATFLLVDGWPALQR